MKTIIIREPGGPDNLVVTEQAIPEPSAGQVLIKVAAAGVNRPDVLQRKGLYKPPDSASPVPGLEVAGEIVAGDAAAAGLSIGDSVCALVPGGGYAEYCVTAARHCLPVPRGWQTADAASLPETCFTVWSNLFERGVLSTGETVLVQGGSSGIGVTAIQMASALGHRVFATAGSADKVAACEALGAEGINYRTEDFEARIKSLTEQRGVDVILDIVGGDYVAREIRCLADDGRLVIIGVMGGVDAALPLWDMLSRRLTVTGSTLRPRSDHYKAQLANALKRNIWPLLDKGHMRPVIAQTFPLEQASEAHKLMESSNHIGKILLTTA